MGNLTRRKNILVFVQIVIIMHDNMIEWVGMIVI